jgi:hypothetical protein
VNGARHAGELEALDALPMRCLTCKETIYDD